MSIQKITLATALLLTLTACSSGGKGTDHTARQENAKLQTQVKALQQKAEEAQKKADLATERAKKAEQAVNSASKNAKEIEALKREAAQAKAIL